MRGRHVTLRLIAAACLVALGLTPALAKDGQKLGNGYERFALEHQFAFEVFEELNARSVEVNLEYCGFMYFDAQGELRATPPEKGGSHSCLPIRPTEGWVFASYHTHAAFDPNSLNEYPSEQDMEGDFANRQNGYIATPGGRMWFVDHEKQVARQLCGYRCLPFDRRYVETKLNRPKTAVTLPNLAVIVEETFGE